MVNTRLVSMANEINPPNQNLSICVPVDVHMVFHSLEGVVILSAPRCYPSECVDITSIPCWLTHETVSNQLSAHELLSLVHWVVIGLTSHTASWTISWTFLFLLFLHVTCLVCQSLQSIARSWDCLVIQAKYSSITAKCVCSWGWSYNWSLDLTSN